MRFDEGFLDELRSRNDIENVIAPYTELKRAGRLLKGLCPFHNESTPSFTVYPDNQSFYCFGCGVGGDAITFVRKIENLTYTDAVRLLCDRSGMNMPFDTKDDELGKLKRRTLEANREAAKFFHSMLLSPQGKPFLDYLHRRGVSDEMITHFGLGFAPDSGFALLNHMRKLGFSDSELIPMDLCRRSQKGRAYDTFRNRLMIPIIDIRGNVIAFGGRVSDDTKPKYLNTGDTVVFKKGQGLFALNFAKNGGKRKLILCEGYMDVIAFHQYGFTNAVAGLGTALTPEQAKLLSRYADEVYLCYDSDDAGIKATNKALAIFEKTNLKIKIIRLRGGKDPDEILRLKGPEFMSAIIEGSKNNTEFRLNLEREKYGTDTGDAKNNFLNAGVKILAEVKNPVELDIYERQLSEETGVSMDAIKALVQREKQRELGKRDIERFENARQSLRGNGTPIPGLREHSSKAASKAQRIIIASLMKNPDFVKNVEKRLSAEDFIDKFYGNMYSCILDRVKNLRSTELISFSDELSVDEMSLLTKITIENRDITNTLGEVYECIETIKKEKNTEGRIAPSEMNDQDFLALFKK